MRVRNKRWAWFSQTVDALLVVAGLVTIGAMIYRWSFPLGAIALSAFCVGGLTAGQLIDLLVGRWTGGDDAKP
jgi:hypothetical protein